MSTPPPAGSPVVVVTGAARGLGAAVAATAVSGGARVAALDVEPDWSGGDAQLFRWQVDITSADAVSAAVAACRDRWGGITHLVNAAGTYPRGDLGSTSPAMWRRVLEVNVTGPFLLIQAVAPLMAAGGGGCVVNLGSLHAHGGAVDLLAYAVSKGGLRTMTHNLALALAPQRIRVNAVDPGWVATDGEVALRAQEGRDPGWLADRGRGLPLGRLQQPAEIAAAVMFLLSDDASQITGQTIAVDGGMGLRAP